MNETITSPAAGLSESGNAVMSCGEAGAALSVAAEVLGALNGLLEQEPQPSGRTPAQAGYGGRPWQGEETFYGWQGEYQDTVA
jgi:hypothetical protein